jgi:hypothetical protein
MREGIALGLQLGPRVNLNKIGGLFCKVAREQLAEREAPSALVRGGGSCRKPPDHAQSGAELVHGRCSTEVPSGGNVICLFRCTSACQPLCLCCFRAFFTLPARLIRATARMPPWPLLCLLLLRLDLLLPL